MANRNLSVELQVGLAAVKQDGLAIKFLSAERQADKEVALEAVKQNGISIGECWVEQVQST